MVIYVNTSLAMYVNLSAPMLLLEMIFHKLLHLLFIVILYKYSYSYISVLAGF